MKTLTAIIYPGETKHWQVVSNAAQPYLPPLTNPATFFRAVK